jgi:hypothetical protein
VADGRDTTSGLCNPFGGCGPHSQGQNASRNSAHLGGLGRFRTLTLRFA